MQTPPNVTPWFQRQGWALFILVSSIFLAYSNTWFAGWHLDDFPNIVNNSALHIDTISPSSLGQTFFANPRNPHTLFRPVPCLSFAINWYLGQDNVFGYHVFNIFLHFCVSALLYLTILLLFKTPRLQNKWTGREAAIALLASMLWALHPIQTQAVTYIVQRMALLAGFFYLGAIFFYLKARLQNNSATRKTLYFTLTFCCFILALGSKENAITLPAGIILLEIIFFNILQKYHWKYLLYSIFFCLIIASAGLFILTGGNASSIISGYEHRSFTLTQRLLTEPRIITFYLSQIFYPVPNRFSLDHDILVSTSLTTPFSTVIALIFLFILTIFPLLFYKKYPLSAFAILYFLLNHVVESSFISLELIFEHRNYLPSMFIFVPPAACMVWLIDHFNSQKIFIRTVLACFCLLLVFEFALSTFQRNRVWATEQSLWEDGLQKAPGSSRPYINLAFIYRQKGDIIKAFELCRRSLDKSSPTPGKDRMRAYNNMGLIMMDHNNFPMAVTYFSKALTNKSNINSKFYLHKALLANGETNKAEQILKSLLVKFPNDSYLLTSMGIILTDEKQYQKAETFFNKALKSSKQNISEQLQATICLGSLYSRQGQFNKAKNIFLSALPIMPESTPILCLIGNELLHGHNDQALIFYHQLLKNTSVKKVINLLKTSYRKNIIFPVTADRLCSFLIANNRHIIP